MSKEYKITKQGSLGLLALGHIGIIKWREVVNEIKKVRGEESSKREDDVKKKK